MNIWAISWRYFITLKYSCNVSINKHIYKMHGQNTCVIYTIKTIISLHIPKNDCGAIHIFSIIFTTMYNNILDDRLGVGREVTVVNQLILFWLFCLCCFWHTNKICPLNHVKPIDIMAYTSNMASENTIQFDIGVYSRISLNR